MRLGMMQPYFFPYLGYFALIDRCDRWVVFDVTQYTPKSWMNRNRVLHPVAGWAWVSVPLSNSSQSITIAQARILDREATLRTTLGKLSHYRHRAPHWQAVEAIVEIAFGQVAGDSLTALNVSGMRAVCEYLGISFDPQICSELGVDLSGVSHPGGWAPAIAAALGAERYLNPIGGSALFRAQEFAERGVELEFLEAPDFRYPTGPYAFEPGLSILDALMWNEPAVVRSAIAKATVRPAADVLVAPPGGAS